MSALCLAELSHADRSSAEFAHLVTSNTGFAFTIVDAYNAITARDGLIDDHANNPQCRCGDEGTSARACGPSRPLD